jgi:hypothetical protein
VVAPACIFVIRKDSPTGKQLVHLVNVATLAPDDNPVH